MRAEIEGASIVLVGAFNPAIFNPDWLAARSLIRGEEAAAATITAISPDLAVFSMKWLELEVTRDRFMAHTSDPSNFPTLKEVVEGIYRLLEHTPIRQMGLNTDRHFRMANVNDWHGLGDRLAPKPPWRDVLKGVRPEGLPGLKSVVVEGIREGSGSKFLNVTVEPSTRVVPGVYIATNEHYESAVVDSPSEILVQLERNWRPALEFSSRVCAHVLSRPSL